MKPPIYITAVGKSLPQPHVQRPNGWQYHHFFLISAGSGIFRMGGNDHLLEAGSGVFLRSNCPHEYFQVKPPFSTLWVTFDGAGCSALLDAMNAGEYLLLDAQQAKPLFSQHEILRKGWTSGMSMELLSVQLYQMIQMFFLASVAPKVESISLRANQYMERHCGEVVTLKELADVCSLSPSAFGRIYKEETGVSAFYMLQRIRVDRAKRLLLQPDVRPISEIAAACGFNDTSYFCQVFRRFAGCTPTIYRQGDVISKLP